MNPPYFIIPMRRFWVVGDPWIFKISNFKEGYYLGS